MEEHFIRKAWGK